MKQDANTNPSDWPKVGPTEFKVGRNRYANKIAYHVHVGLHISCNSTYRFSVTQVNKASSLRSQKPATESRPQSVKHISYTFTYCSYKIREIITKRICLTEILTEVSHQPLFTYTQVVTKMCLWSLVNKCKFDWVYRTVCVHMHNKRTDENMKG